MVKELLKYPNVDVNAQDTQKLLPMHFAAKEGHVEICKILVEAGSYTTNDYYDELETDEKTPLHYAAYNGHTDVVTYLLEDQRVFPDPRDWDDFTPLQLAVFRNQRVVIKKLLERG